MKGICICILHTLNNAACHAGISMKTACCMCCCILAYLWILHALFVAAYWHIYEYCMLYVLLHAAISMNTACSMCCCMLAYQWILHALCVAACWHIHEYCMLYVLLHADISMNTACSMCCWMLAYPWILHALCVAACWHIHEYCMLYVLLHDGRLDETKASQSLKLQRQLLAFPKFATIGINTISADLQYFRGFHCNFLSSCPGFLYCKARTTFMSPWLFSDS